MEFYEVRSKINILLKYYLENIYQRVLIEIKDSYHSIFYNWGRINHGVPQGSILGALLFLFFMNDLTKTIKMSPKPFLFADDSNLSITNTSPAEFKKYITTAFVPLNESFNGNSLFLNYERNKLFTFND